MVFEKHSECQSRDRMGPGAGVQHGDGGAVSPWRLVSAASIGTVFPKSEWAQVSVSFQSLTVPTTLYP